MSFVPNTEEDRKKMLESIGVTSFEELISQIPDEIKLKKDLNLPARLSEFEVIKVLESFASKNKTAATHSCFMGGGAYDHFIPTVVYSVLERPEFKTAYTPYQAEVSQGTLQAMYEFQSMICNLTGMDVANASLYDGATALAEACLLSHAQTKKKRFLIAGTVNPHYLHVLKTICSGRELEFEVVASEDGTCDITSLKSAYNDDVAAVIVQQPNFYGNLEDVQEIEAVAHSSKALFIVSCDPMTLGMLAAPGDYNADIVVGEAQPLGIPLNFGGPYVGIFAVKKNLVRKIPGRLSGVTVDSDGQRSFVLTLQTREQQIKREKATSNICTNQGLFMLAATVYMETMGKEGIKEVSEQSFHKAHYFAEQIASIPGFRLLNDKPFFREFLVIPPVPAAQILDVAEEESILGGIDTSIWSEYHDGLLIAVTEKRTKKEIDDYIAILRKFAKE